MVFTLLDACQIRVRYASTISKPVSCTVFLSKDTRGDVSIVMKSATKLKNMAYKIQKNVLYVDSSKVLAGKAAIRFLKPPHEVRMSGAAPRNLKELLTTVINIMESDDQCNAIPKALISMIPCNKKEAPTRIKIVGDKDVISSLPRRIRNSWSEALTCLQLVDCGMTEVPYELGKLPLKCLDLNSNMLAKSSWSFLEQRPVMKSLEFLSLAKNNLSYVPLVIVDLESLITLDLDSNRIVSENLPHALALCKSLRYLKLSNNCLTVLPQIYDRLAGFAFDFKGNNFLPLADYIPPELRETNVVPSLASEAARTIWLYRLGYNFKYPMEVASNAAKDIIRSCSFCSCGAPGIACMVPKYRTIVSHEFKGIGFDGIPNSLVVTYTNCRRPSATAERHNMESMDRYINENVVPVAPYALVPLSLIHQLLLLSNGR